MDDILKNLKKTYGQLAIGNIAEEYLKDIAISIEYIKNLETNFLKAQDTISKRNAQIKRLKARNADLRRIAKVNGIFIKD